MGLSAVLISFLFCLLCFYTPTTTAHICQISCSGRRDVQVFPFPSGLNDTLNYICRYPGFNISCNNQNGAILTLPNSVQFAVLAIDYKSQRITLTLLNSVQFAVLAINYKSQRITLTYRNSGIPDRFLSESSDLTRSPFTAVNDMDDLRDPTGSFVLVLEWSKANCSRCEQFGGTCCGHKSNQCSEIECSGVPSEEHRIPRSAKYGIIIGIGIPMLLCFIGLSCYICNRVYAYSHRRRHPTIEFLTSIALQPAVGGAGLDGPTIESYPKTLLGESRRLPNPSDNTCSICLSEYQPKEALRTIPDCKHYFHADCIDEWLRMNTTCPLCRNSPERSMSVTPSTSLSSSSSSFSFVVWTV
ncbi:hypothetical protein SLA2020_402010 [Shorea laevis]